MRPAVEHRDPRRALLAAGADIVIAGREQREAAARQIDFDGLARVEADEMDADPPLAQRDLQDALIKPRDLDLAAAGQRDHRGADAERRPAASAGAQ